MKKKLHFVVVISGLVSLLFSCLLVACGDSATGSSPAVSSAGSGGYAKIATSGGYLNTIKERGRLLIGNAVGNPGFSLKNATTGQPEGFDIDIGRELAKVLLNDPAKADFVEIVSPSRLPSLEQDSVDLVISTMTITEERRQRIDFSEVYFQAGQSLLVRKGSPIRGLADLSGKVVCVVRDTTNEKNIRQKAPAATIQLLSDYEPCVNQLEVGLVDVVTSDDILLLGYIREKPGKFEMVGGQFTQEPYGIGVKKGRPELLKFVNSVLAEMRANGRWQALYDKYIKG